MAPKIDMTPTQVHQLGHAATDVADTPLTKASKAMSEGYDHEGTAKLNGFLTKSSLDTALIIWDANASYDVTTIRSMGSKLHMSANAIVHGDNHGVDEFKYVPVVYQPHHGYQEMQ